MCGGTNISIHNEKEKERMTFIDNRVHEMKSEPSNQLRSRVMMIAGNAEGILSRVAVDPGIGIRRPVRVLRRRRSRDIRRPAAAAAATAAAAAAVAAATSGL